MAAWIVRPRLTGDQQKGGAEGAGGVVIYAVNPQKAKEYGSERLGIPAHRLEAIETDSRSYLAIQGEVPPDEDLEAMRQDLFSGGVQVVGEWENEGGA